jgi:hypothetical protein
MELSPSPSSAYGRFASVSPQRIWDGVVSFSRQFPREEPRPTAWPD